MKVLKNIFAHPFKFPIFEKTLISTFQFFELT